MWTRPVNCSNMWWKSCLLFIIFFLLLFMLKAGLNLFQWEQIKTTLRYVGCFRWKQPTYCLLGCDWAPWLLSDKTQKLFSWLCPIIRLLLRKRNAEWRTQRSCRNLQSCRTKKRVQLLVFLCTSERLWSTSRTVQTRTKCFSDVRSISRPLA